MNFFTNTSHILIKTFKNYIIAHDYAKRDSLKRLPLIYFKIIMFFLCGDAGASGANIHAGVAISAFCGVNYINIRTL